MKGILTEVSSVSGTLRYAPVDFKFNASENPAAELRIRHVDLKAGPSGLSPLVLIRVGMVNAVLGLLGS